MLATGIALKYARALFAEAKVQERLDRVAADMDALRHLGTEDPAFLNFLLSPEISTDTKTAFVNAVFAPRLDPLAVNFLRLVVEKGRINLLPDMCAAFQRLAEAERGILRAQVDTAVPLEPDQEERLKRQLDRLTGKQVLLEKVVDPSLLGGMVVHLGDKIIDRSVRRGLRRLAVSLLHTELESPRTAGA